MGTTSRKWVWSTKPRLVFQEDGTERGSIIVTSNRGFEAWGEISSATRWSRPP